MGKQGLLHVALGVAVGACLVLGCWVVYMASSPRIVLGGTVDTQGNITVATGRLKGQGEADGLYIYDHEKHKLAVYMINGRNFEILAVRDLQYDFVPQQYSAKGGQHIPSVNDMREGTKKQ